MQKYVMCIIAAPADKAEQIAETLVTEKLAACCQVNDGITSFYYWKGKLNRDREALIFIKTGTPAVSKIKDRLKEVHPYTVPEFIVIPVIDGNEDYLKWIDENVDRG
ncbi:MAG: divalent-cation tolerance protein CutA [Spirochaetales bacterium]|nr:divalent-cation tolerance protein CutA [Spirochaetales bacterium]